MPILHWIFGRLELDHRLKTCSSRVILSNKDGFVLIYGSVNAKSAYDSFRLTVPKWKCSSIIDSATLQEIQSIHHPIFHPIFRDLEILHAVMTSGKVGCTLSISADCAFAQVSLDTESYCTRLLSLLIRISCTVRDDWDGACSPLSARPQ